MNRLRFISAILCVFALLCPAREARALDMAGLEAQVRDLANTVRELQTTVAGQAHEIESLRRTVPAVEGPAATAPASRSLQGKWNPDIGVVADVVATLDTPKSDAEGADRVAVREVELVFGSNVDPYSRLDATLSISDFEEMAVEEAYLTRYGLPLGFTGRFGRFKPRIGKAVGMHRDSLDTVDEPLVIQRYFGVEGMSKTGADIVRGIDLPWPVTHEVTLGVLEGASGEGGTAFGTARRMPTLYAHLKNYLDLDDTTGLEFGQTFVTGSKDDDEQFETNIAGLDAALIHQYGSLQHVKLQSEAFYMSREDSFVDVMDDTTGDLRRIEFDGTLWGLYVLADWRFDPQWAAGYRHDYVELVDFMPVEGIQGFDDGDSVYLTFYQSEFARWRAQYTHNNLAAGEDEHRILLQGTFAIGEHKHKLQ